MTLSDPLILDGPPERKPGEFRRDPDGSPRVTTPDGALVKSGANKGKPKTDKYSRPSGYGKLIEDTTNLQKWSERAIVAGFVLGLDEQTAWNLGDAPPVDPDGDEWRDFADSIAKAAKDRAKYMLAAERGTHAHELTEHADTERDPVVLLERGRELGIDDAVSQRLLNAWATMLNLYGLEILATELAVVNDTYRAAGTLDRIVRLTRPISFVLADGEVVTLAAGTVVILDIKTGKLRTNAAEVQWWESYAAQVFLYASGTGYDVDAEVRYDLPWQVDQRWAIIAHLDVLAAIDGREECNLILVDLDAGKAACDLVRAAKELGKRSKFSLVGTAQPIGVAPDPHKHSKDFAPTATVTVAPPDEGTTVGDDRLEPLRARYRAVNPAWINALRAEALDAGCDFHLKPAQTIRRYRIMDGLLTLTEHDCTDDDVVKALVRHVAGEDAAMWPTISSGAAVGSLSAVDAAAFVVACEAFVAGRYIVVGGPDFTIKEVAA